MHLTYPYAGNLEFGIAIDKGRSGRLLLVPPLFDEMNRMRHTLVETMRALDALDIDSMLADLPGTNESLSPLQAQSLRSWTGAVCAAAEHFNANCVASFRGGALIDHGAGDAMPRWRMAPTRGSGLLRTLMRTRLASDKETGVRSSLDDIATLGRSRGVTLAGNDIPPDLFSGLDAAVPAAAPCLREVLPAREMAEGRVIGTPLWLRAEPGHDPAMADAMAVDIAGWMQS